MRRVALVYDAVYPYVIGGAERRFHELGKALAAAGFDVHLYGMKYWDGPRVVERDGLTLHGLCAARPLYTTGGRRSIGQALLFGLASLRMVFERFDVIDCCGFPYFSLFGCKLAAVLRRKPLWATWHEVWGREYWTTYLGRLGAIGFAVERLAVRLPDRIIAVSESTADQVRSGLGCSTPLVTLPNGVDTAAIAAVAPDAATSDVVYAGRLVDFKNVDLLLRAMALLATRRPEVTCTIVGDGPARPGLERLRDELGLGARVRFTGFVDDSATVYGLLKASRVFVLPSAREGFGICVLEAHAAGLPVVTVDLPGNAARHLVTDSTGAVVPADPVALARAVEEQLRSRSAGDTYTERATAFDWAATAGRLEELWAS